MKPNEQVNRMIETLQMADNICDKLTDRVILSIGPYSIYFFGAKRTDLEAIMSLFPGRVWSKSTDGDILYYTINVDDISWVITTGELPPTCKVVYEDVELPPEPAQPARTVKRAKIVCN
jgi:hypothetical protein